MKLLLVSINISKIRFMVEQNGLKENDTFSLYGLGEYYFFVPVYFTTYLPTGALAAAHAAAGRRRRDMQPISNVHATSK